jgi:hypothetical protein
MWIIDGILHGSLDSAFSPTDSKINTRSKSAKRRVIAENHLLFTSDWPVSRSNAVRSLVHREARSINNMFIPGPGIRSRNTIQKAT